MIKVIFKCEICRYDSGWIITLSDSTYVKCNDCGGLESLAGWTDYYLTTLSEILEQGDSDG